MLFEVYNDKAKRVYFTHDISCIPEKEHIDSMLKNGYKIKVEGKTLTKKAINELYKKGAGYAD